MHRWHVEVSALGHGGVTQNVDGVTNDSVADYAVDRELIVAPNLDHHHRRHLRLCFVQVTEILPQCDISAVHGTAARDVSLS